MELKEMSVEELEARKAAIAEEVEAPEADLDALESEIRGINAELEERKATEAKKVEVRKAVAEGAGEVIRKFEKEERKEMSEIEVRNSKEYIDAYAEYLKTGDDKECRSLLTENATTNGTLPVPTFVGEIIAEEFKASPILNRIRKNYVGGNYKQPFEYGAPIAGVHAEGDEAIAEEALLIGYVEMKPQTWKKWVGISDEALDLYNGEAYLRYLYTEISRGIVKAREKAVIDAILAAPQTATASAPAVAKTGAAASAIDDIVKAEALIGDAADDLIVIVSKADYAMYRGLQFGANYGVDPFDGLEVIKSNYATVPIVGDLRGVMENFIRGSEEIQMKYDDKTRMKEDMVDVLGRMPSAIEVVGNLFFAKVSA